jgi:hypothetical protein
MLNNFHVTVIPFSYKSKEYKIEDHHLQLLKFALIYADKTQLISLAFPVDTFIDFAKKDTEIQKIWLPIDVIEKIDGTIMQQKDIDKYLKEINVDWEGLFNNKVKDFILYSYNESRDKKGLNKLIPFVKEDILDVDPVGKSIMGEKTIPLFDEAGLVQIKKLISQKKIELPDAYLNKIKYSTLASELFQRLPDFEKVTIDQIHDIRNTLKKPLVIFRSTMIKLSKEIESFPWDESFFMEVDDLIIRDLKPAILGLEEACKSNSYLRVLSRNILERNSWALPSGFGFVISKLSDLSFVSSLLIGLATGMTKVALKTFIEWQDKRNKLMMNPYFFYYRIKNKLK